MGDVLTPVEVENEIWRLSRRCEDVTKVTKERALKAAECDVAFKLAWAKAMLAADGKTVADREAYVITVTEGEYRERKIAEALMATAVEAGRNYRAQLSALQSVNANLRHQAGL